MKNFRITKLLAFLALVVLLGGAFAVPAGADSVTAIQGTVQTVDSIFYQEDGDDHVNMAITGFFVDINGNFLMSDTIYWQAGTPGDGKGSASDHGWGVSLNGDSFTSSWVLTNNKTLPNNVPYYLDYVIFDALSGNAVFDRTDPNPGTNGSAAGNDFQRVSVIGWTGDIAATYYDAVVLSGGNPQNDVYARMKIDFDNPFTGALEFKADTDVVPVPASVLLLASGLLGLAGLGWRRRNS